jgi:hypothetical protein
MRNDDTNIFNFCIFFLKTQKISKKLFCFRHQEKHVNGVAWSKVKERVNFSIQEHVLPQQHTAVTFVTHRRHVSNKVLSA